MRRVVRVLAAVVLGLAMVGVPSTAAAAQGSSGPAGPGGPATLDTNGAPVPTLDWGPCPDQAVAAVPAQLQDQYQCDVVEVPLSYRRPHGQSIQLAVGRLPAADQDNKIGSLFYNPGGPGGSGRIPPKFSAKLHQRFDIVGFDPRGTNASTPVRCFTSPEQAIRLFGWQFPITLAQEQKVIDKAERGTEACARNGGPLLSHMSTANVARDLDLLRQAVGDDMLSYLGYSYGTQIGEVYANLFPDRVRALVLDGVLNPVEWTNGEDPDDRFKPIEYRLGSFNGTQQALRTFLSACQADQRCAFRAPDVDDLYAKYQTLMQRLRDEPARVTGPDGQTTKVTYQDAVGTTLSLLYAASAASTLADMLQQLYEATSTQARARTTPPRVDMPDVATRPTYAARQPTPYLGIEWFNAVECLDSSNPGNPYVWPRYARKAGESAPGFGPAWVYGSLPCATWPASDPDRYTGPWNRDTANPVLLVGNRKGDPATPYVDAQATAGILANARLLSVDTYGHAAAFLGVSDCANQNVQHYLLTTKLPPKGTVCQPNRDPFDPVQRRLRNIPTTPSGPPPH